MAHFDFVVEHVAGKDHLIADALSRAPVFSLPEDEMISVNSTFVNNLAADPTLHTFQEAAKSDDDYHAVVLALLNGKDPNMLPPGHPVKMFRSIWN